MLTVNGMSGARLVITTLPRLHLPSARRVSAGSKPSSTSASPSEMMVLAALPNTSADSTTPPRWAMPWISLMRMGTPARRQASPSTLEASRLPCPPTATITSRLVSIGVFALLRPPGRAGLFFDGEDGVFRAYLGAEGATGAQVRVDVHALLPKVEGRAGQLAQAGAVVRALGRHLEGLALRQMDGAGVERADLLGDDDRNARELQRLAHGLDAL